MIAIIDYGMGNLRSVHKALEQCGAQAAVTDKPEAILSAKKIVLPGVGAIKPAMERLYEMNLLGVIKDFVQSGRPFFGICLGLQLLFEGSDEGGDVTGLGLLKGRVRRFSPDVKVPHMGWNNLTLQQPQCPIFQNIAEDPYVYFCHSYYVDPTDLDVTAASCDYGQQFTAAASKDNLFGVQFHPEKSQGIGLSILKNFVEYNS